MNLPRRAFLHFFVGAALPAISPLAWAQQIYPSRPVRVIVPFAAGGGTDLRARLLGQWLSERLGQQFVIENRPGAGGNIGTELVVKAPSDGHTLLLVGTSSAINATLYEKLSFNFVRDVVPVAGISRNSFIMLVHPSVPVATVPEMIAYAKANPGKLNMASAGNGSLAHLAGELFKMITGVNLVHVPYRGGGPAMTDLIGGQVQIAFEDMSSSIEHVRARKLRAIAVTTATRLDALPDVPSIGEFVPGYEASGWSGIGAPRNTPIDVQDKLNKEINSALAHAKIKARLADLGGTALALSSGEFGKLIAEETEKWGKVIRAARIKA